MTPDDSQLFEAVQATEQLLLHAVIFLAVIGMTFVVLQILNSAIVGWRAYDAHEAGKDRQGNRDRNRHRNRWHERAHRREREVIRVWEEHCGAQAGPWADSLADRAAVAALRQGQLARGGDLVRYEGCVEEAACAVREAVAAR